MPSVGQQFAAQCRVIVATVMHGAANIATPILLPGVDSQTVQLVTGSIYVVLAAALAVRLRASRPVATEVTRRRQIGAAAEAGSTFRTEAPVGDRGFVVSAKVAAYGYRPRISMASATRLTASR